MQSNIVFKFSRPSGAPTAEPSRAMTNALQQLSQSEELEPVLAEAKKRGRKLVVQVFHSRRGTPFLIHLESVPEDAA